MLRGFARKSIWGILFSLFSVVLISAQVSDCTALLEDALSAVEDNCNGTGRNEACYGFDQVSASFISDVGEDYFTQPADISPVAELETIRTAALDLESGVWGVAMMNIQADIPNTLPGQSVTFMLMGDVEVENGVDPETALEPVDGIEVTVTSPAGANIRSGAGLNFNVVGGARLDETMIADGISENGDWFRVVYRDRIAWVSRTVIDDSIDGLEDLPVWNNEQHTPMQAFYLRTGIGQPECEEIPDDILLVQGPEDIEVHITANGADIEIGSTIGLRIIIIDGEPYLEVIAFAGQIEFMGQTLTAGQSSHACLGEEDSRGQDGNDNDLVVTCDASIPQTADDYGEAWCVLEELPSDLLNYPINILCPGETPVVSGGTGATASNISGVNCGGFGLISPLSPVNSGNQTFSWNPVSGNNITYQLVFWNYEGVEVESFYTTETSYTVNLGADTSTGGSFSWEVRAYQNGQYACVTFRSPTLTRTGELNPANLGPGFAASHSMCFANGATYETTVTWSGAPSGAVIITWRDSFGTSGSAAGNAESGSVRIQTSYFVYTFQSIQVTSGTESINFGPC